MSANQEFEQLPEWLQELWNMDSIIARKAESEIDKLQERIKELESKIGYTAM